MSTIPAGWYPDPEREGATRWWDGERWAPSQDAGAGTPAGGDAAEDRFRRPEGESGESSPSDASAGADLGGQPGAEQGTSDQQPWQQGASGQEPWQQGAPGQEPWQQGAAGQQPWQSPDQPSWQQAPAEQSWQQAPAWGAPQDQGAGGAWQQPQYGAPQDWSTPSWNQAAAQPRKSRTGLIVGLSVGAVVLLGLLIGGGVLVAGIVGGIATSAQQVAQGGPDPASSGDATSAGAIAVGESTDITVERDGETSLELVVDQDGDYAISVETVNGEDPVLTLIGPGGEQWQDDDGGGYPNPLLEERLDAGTYTIIVHEYGGDELTAIVSVSTS